MGLFDKLSHRRAKRNDGRGGYVWSREMVLCVAVPAGRGWQRKEAGRHPDGLLAAFKCSYGKPPHALVLDASVYLVPEAQRASAAELEQRDWRAEWSRTTFARIDELIARVAPHPAAGDALELCIEGECRQPQQPLRIRQWHIPDGQQLLVVGAAAAPEHHLTHAKTIELWLMNVQLGA